MQYAYRSINSFHSIGAAANFGTNHSKWSILFPRIRPRLTTLRINTLMPLSREVLLGCGICSPSAKSLINLLSQSNDPNDKSNRDGCTSNAVALIVGGFREVGYTYPNRYRCVLKTRKGFARIALQTGAALVPALSFGENNYFDVIDVSKSKFFQWFTKDTKNHLPLCNGRGFLQYNFGIIPRRHAITTVIGAPIHFERLPNPTDDEVNAAHQLFCTQINELFEAHKSKYIENAESIQLEFV